MLLLICQSNKNDSHSGKSDQDDTCDFIKKTCMFKIFLTTFKLINQAEIKEVGEKSE